jgi:allantoate deiminase
MAVDLNMLGARAEARCRELSRPPYSEQPDGLTRLFLTPAHRATMDRIASWMHDAGLAVSEDELATLTGRRDGSTPDAPALVFGSHIDSVRDAGCYDGPLGVMLGLACVEALKGMPLPFAIEVLAFGDEEGSRFQASMNASRAFAGRSAEIATDATDRTGVSMHDALVAFGKNPLRLDSAHRSRGSVLGYIEPHIEQGPALETANVALGVVTAIAGQKRLKVRIEGQAGHAGTTPMNLRRDALAAAAACVSEIERIGGDGPVDFVATVGVISASPGAPNVIPGAAEFTIDVRAGTDPVRDAGLAQIERALAQICEDRRVGLDIRQVQDLPATPMDARLQALLRGACAEQGFASLDLVSGAGHDAMTVAGIAPSAMLFIRCAGGISHNPAESVLPEDCEKALAVLVSFVKLLAAEHAS